MRSDDTIVAIGSASGSAARMIVRVAGPASGAILRSLANVDLSAGAHRLTLTIAGMPVPAWVYSFVRPRSYTGDDAIELHIPGNPLLARMTLDEVVRLGARPAEPGEFTARAYFNGQMDLTEAEGVAATIAAHGEDELAAARQLMSGELAKRLRPMMERVAETLSLVEAGIDFSDEDVTFIPAADVARRARDVEAQLDRLERESARFDRLSHETEFVLVGRPNAGKSTLLNALAGRERAVVSPVAGTTRDALSAEVALKRGLVRITDVAGLDASPTNEIERKMQSQAHDAIARADYVLEVRDPADDAPSAVPRKPDLVIRTKADVHPDADVSALTGQGLDELKDRLDALAFGRPSGSSLALNARHLSALADARRLLTKAADAATANQPAEIIAFELRAALDAIGSILGHITPDDVLGRVFATFCIGK